ncbi:membrane protein [Gordoniibacillus kamchatkensis]|uniref:histidine kinase n=1 Tax=Gordoniibacillus kamchatkensis TaxID=1590651 RepID=A0ABR5AMJ6_9BACL|nr:ATP-binding protein [Paenibacillus sp. VKM B-2647]KIL42251.1 membrane protein [Paenibacillus sp. VKM B-2647]
MRRLASALRRFVLPQSLRYQLLSRSLLVMAILLLFIGLFQYLFMSEFIYKNRAQSMQSQILAVPRDQWLAVGNRGGSAPGDGGPGPGGGGRLQFLFTPDSSAAFIDPNGQMIVLMTNFHGNLTPPRLSEDVYKEAMAERRRLNYRVVQGQEGGPDQLVVLQSIEIRGRLVGMVQMSVDTKPLKDVLFRQLLIFLALSGLAMLVGMLAFLPVLKRTLVPLSRMVSTVKQIDAGNLDERFPAHQGQVEVDRLAISFNGMLERLEASFAAEKEAKESMRRFVADASHELRTPLTSIHGFLEVLLRGAMYQPEQLRKALVSMQGESARINKLVQDLLLLAKLDRAPELELAAAELDALVHEMEPHLRMLAGQRDVVLRLSPQTRCRIDADKMKQVLLNLFANAVQHTDPQQGRIEIEVESGPETEEVRLTVRDNGPGIAADHLPHIFDRFYRKDSSRTRKSGGAGLGLSIAKSLVEEHGGSLEADSREGEGASFTVRLPANEG